MPWCFENNLVLPREIEGDEQPEQVIITHSLFWVRVTNLPFNCRSNENIKALTARLREFLEIKKDL